MPSSGVKTCALRSEEHTSELQSHDNLVCRLLLEKTYPASARPRGRGTPPPPPAPRGASRARARAWVVVAGGGGPRGGALVPGCRLFFFKARGPPPFLPSSPTPPPAS